MQRQILCLLGLFLLASGCTQFQSGRTFLTEMEHDDSRFFNPENDFPVVVGDNGEFGLSSEERRARTPASEEDIAQRRFRKSLQEELRELEAAQSERNLKFYQTYEKHLTTTSEKIYFLKLPPRERKEYLEVRGFIPVAQEPAYSAAQIKFGVRHQNILLGMTKNDVIESWGKPSKVEIAGNPNNENERWAYNYNGRMKFIYFESGQVQGWE